MGFKFVIILAICSLSFGLISSKPKTQKDSGLLWLKNLINFILEETDTHRTIIITDKQQNTVAVDTEINTIVAEFSQKMPVMLFVMEEIIQSRHPDTFACDMSHFHKEQLFFIYINSFGYSLPEHSRNTTDMLRWLSCNTLNEKILLVLFRERDPDLKEELRYAWEKRILEYTILDIVVKKESGSFFLPQDTIWVSKVVHRLNPFKDEYTREEYKTGTEFFPKKLKDMNGYKLNTSMIHLPPGSDLKKNKSGHVIDVTGTDGMVLKTLEKTLNFKANLITSKIDTFGKIFPNGKCISRDSKFRSFLYPKWVRVFEKFNKLTGFYVSKKFEVILT